MTSPGLMSMEYKVSDYNKTVSYYEHIPEKVTMQENGIQLE